MLSHVDLFVLVNFPCFYTDVKFTFKQIFICLTTLGCCHLSFCLLGKNMKAQYINMFKFTIASWSLSHLHQCMYVCIHIGRDAWVRTLMEFHHCHWIPLFLEFCYFWNYRTSIIPGFLEIWKSRNFRIMEI